MELNRELSLENRHLLKKEGDDLNITVIITVQHCFIHHNNIFDIYKPDSRQIKEYWLRTTAPTQQKDQGTRYLETSASNPLQLCTADKHKLEHNNRAIYARKASHGLPYVLMALLYLKSFPLTNKN